LVKPKGNVTHCAVMVVYTDQTAFPMPSQQRQTNKGHYNENYTELDR